LKGEKPKTNIKPKTTKELNPHPKKKHKKKSKKADLKIDVKIKLDVDKEELPPNAKFIGTRKIIVQELKIERRNIEFLISRYWSKALGKFLRDFRKRANLWAKQSSSSVTGFLTVFNSRK
jgi:hypothetical protein